ncbi:hypothetical protein HPP92_028843 [Vanilla planifolia]|uniref:Uncharacterized protein n=1 Tax=Vanilla planifolia TaxID=51239 RepID=A0A835U2H0_VANPL|nr:hypothetical protein HPP92_028843 [Vanilla planifolia]KAG0446438.1 hypothetical protein HPP92_028832 [Vanilla planifolia]
MGLTGNSLVRKSRQLTLLGFGLEEINMENNVLRGCSFSMGFVRGFSAVA